MNPFPTPRGYEPELRKQTERANRLEGELTATKYEVERLEVDLLGERQHVQLHVQRLNPGLCAKYNSPETTPAQWRCLCATVVAEADLERAALRAELDVRLEQIRKKDDELDYLTCSNNALREGLEWWRSLRDASNGLAGYHLNGDVAKWGEFEDPTDAVLAKYTLKMEGTP